MWYWWFGFICFVHIFYGDMITLMLLYWMSVSFAHVSSWQEFVSWNFVSCNCSACRTARFLRMLKFCSALVNKNIMKRQNSCFTVSDSCYVCVTGHGWSGEEVHGSWPRKLEIHRSCTLQGRLKHLSHRSSSLCASSLLLSCDVSMLTLLLLSLDVASCCLCVHCRVLDL